MASLHYTQSAATVLHATRLLLTCLVETFHKSPERGQVHDGRQQRSFGRASAAALRRARGDGRATRRRVEGTWIECIARQKTKQKGTALHRHHHTLTTHDHHASPVIASRRLLPRSLWLLWPPPPAFPRAPFASAPGTRRDPSANGSASPVR